MSITTADVTFHRPTDNTDPGFKIKGQVLRWVSGGVESRRAPRFWSPIRMSKLPKELQTKIKTKVGSLIDGDTIRRRDLILSCAPVDVVSERSAELKDQQRANESVFRANSGIAGSGAARTTGDTGLRNEKMTSENFN
jgi:hypothetical protein